MTYIITEQEAWKNWVTPVPAKKIPVHRWYLFPHSFTADLVHALITEWGLGKQDNILDPFTGAGTTLVAAKEADISATGYDLSPLAVLATNTKIGNFSSARLNKVWSTLESSLRSRNGTMYLSKPYPELVLRALPDGRLEALDAIESHIAAVKCSQSERDFFRLALVSIIPRFSHAVANGGWLRWLNQGERADKVPGCFKQQVESMLSDVDKTAGKLDCNWKARIGDARTMSAPDGTFTAVITSPPYPNRHDYTRVFGVELMFMFHDWEANRALRYQTFHSHPEARPHRPKVGKYNPPRALESIVYQVSDKRIRIMLCGYFLDMYLGLREVARVCRSGAKVAFVLGNARYDGQAVLVDEITAEIGEQAGLSCKEIRTVRWRGNSAQQMGQYGRIASRESVVIFENG